jgi:2-methylcitrate dehydratase PrpD
MLHAIGIAGSHGGGLLEFHHEGAMTKRLHIGRGSQLGVESALLAQKGFTGPSTVLEGGHGFLHVYSPRPKPEMLVKDLGQNWLLKVMSFKAHPCHLSFHAVVDAIIRFKPGHDFSAADIEAVEVRSNQRMMEDRFGERAPTSLMGAQYSLPWSTAHALLHDASAPASWTDEALRDTDVNKLAAMMTLTEAAPETPGAVADVILTIRGQRHVIAATDWKGAPTNPASFDDLSLKLQRYAAGIVPDAQVQQIIERVAKLEDEKNVSGLIELIRA